MRDFHAKSDQGVGGSFKKKKNTGKVEIGACNAAGREKNRRLFFSLKAKPGTLPITQINLHQPETLIIAGSFLTW